MNSRQNAKVMTYGVLVRYLSGTSGEILAQMPHFETLFAEFKQLTLEINDCVGRQGHVIVGYAAQKQQARTQLEVHLLDVLNRVRAYAMQEDDMVLYEELHLKKSRLARISDVSLRAYTTAILPRITSLLPELGAYGVTAAKLATVAENLAAYVALTPKPRKAIATRVLETRKLADYLKKADAMVAKMSTLVAMLAYSEPDFYSNFMDQKKQVKRGHRKLAVVGVLTDKAGVAVARALVEVPELKKAVYTSAEGRFELKHLPGGVYTAYLSKAGYATLVTQIVVTKGITTKLDLRLEQNGDNLKAA